MLKKSLYIMLITVSFCWIILAITQQATQADPPPEAKIYPTLGSSASADGWGCSSSTDPGIGNAVHAKSAGGGWTGTGSARAGIFGFFTLWGGDTTGPENQTIKAWLEKRHSELSNGEVVVGTIGRVWYEVMSTNVSESRWGTPSSDKWASTNGCYGGLSNSAYCESDREW